MLTTRPPPRRDEHSLGCTRFAGFQRMIAAVVAEDWTTASSEIADSDYCRVQVPCRCQQNRLCMDNCFRYTCSMPVAPDTPPCGGGPVSSSTTTTTTTTTTMPPTSPCVYGAWTLFSACNKCDENGEEVYTRTASASCTGETQKVEGCFKACPPPNCVYSSWSTTSLCSATACGTTGVVAERRTVNDVRCPDSLQRTRDCSTAPCGVAVQ